MPVDVDARVVSNIRLSDDYNVVCLDAPSLALGARPGQFVMIKPVAGIEPLLRRPFSIFEVLPGECAVREIHQENITNESKIHLKIDENSMQKLCSKKVCKNDA